MSLYAVRAQMIAAETGRRVVVELFGDLRVGDTQMYACSACGRLTPWATASARPNACAAGCIEARLVYVGVLVPPPETRPGSFATLRPVVYRPDLSAGDVVNLITALGVDADQLDKSDADEARELAELRDLQERLSKLAAEAP